MTCRCNANSLAILHGLSGWWRGAAMVRRELAMQAMLAEGATTDATIKALLRDEQAKHLARAAEYERKAESPPKAGTVLINLRAAGGQ